MAQIKQDKEFNFRFFGLCILPVVIAMIFAGSISEINSIKIMGFVMLALSLGSIIISIFIRIGKKKKELVLQQAIITSNISQIDSLSPYMFEEWVARLLRTMGYKAFATKRSGDYGIDVIAENYTTKIGIQVKKFNKPVGIKAVQEVISGISYYDCNEGWVVTSAQSFTPAAINLARKQNIKLITRNDLAIMLSKLNTN